MVDYPEEYTMSMEDLDKSGRIKLEKTDEEKSGVSVVREYAEGFDDKVKKGVSFVEFSSPGCSACQYIMDPFKRVSAFRGKGESGEKFVYFDTGSAKKSDYQLDSYPQFAIYVDGERKAIFQPMDDLPDGLMDEFFIRDEKGRIQSANYAYVYKPGGEAKFAQWLDDYLYGKLEKVKQQDG